MGCGTSKSGEATVSTIESGRDAVAECQEEEELREQADGSTLNVNELEGTNTVLRNIWEVQIQLLYSY